MATVLTRQSRGRGIAQAIEWLKVNLNKPVRVEELARPALLRVRLLTQAILITSPCTAPLCLLAREALRS